MSYAVIAAFLAVGLAGGLVGVAELVSRYRDAPLEALRTFPAALYVFLNVCASFAALAAIRQAHWFTDVSPDRTNVLIVQTVVAGLAAMAFFRAAFFTVRVGNEDVSVGPAGLLQVLLTAADRAVDRERAGPRAKDIARIMGDISFEKSKQALPSLCFGLMQNVSIEEQKAFGIVVKELEVAAMDEAVKSNNLGLALMNVVGAEVLERAVEILKRTIHATPRPILHSIATLSLLRNLAFDAASRDLVSCCLFVAGLADDAERRGDLEARRGDIAALGVGDDQKTLMLSAYLLSVFGEEIVQSALRAVQPARPPADSTNVVPIVSARTDADAAGAADAGKAPPAQSPSA
jgi:hypothetical protein